MATAHDAPTSIAHGAHPLSGTHDPDPHDLHDSHDPHDEHGPAESATWVLVPLLIGLVIGIIVAITLGLGSTVRAII